jgi:predicted nucleic acid-binding protein
MAVLIDSSVLIDIERGLIDLQGRIHGREKEDFFISVISASELLHGVFRAEDPSIKSRRAAFVEGILQQFPILPIDLAVARSHAQLWADLQSRGEMIGLHDSWLAATCIAHGYTLATGNMREFERVPGLTVECWSQD